MLIWNDCIYQKGWENSVELGTIVELELELELAEVGFLPRLPILHIPELSRSLSKTWVCM